ncbi:Sensor protein KdpD [Candidatus Magnetaquicoccaceae bacterium FCR-1]|uniref:histidine kinase n=1 Tax=Candidatus Magnetaquiglobus chichijimensis TaxID=3141448 RepID=A0ABQ0C5K4_9PROT
MATDSRSDRPDPDAILAQLVAEEHRERRGRLKIFFGACPGVGKTFAMLSAARSLSAQGMDVVAGVVETHGRDETAELLHDLEILPRQRIEYKGHLLEEFDLDAALQRNPRIILIDELAHSNAPGSRHPKRWQDIDELLNAGIDVLTTVNVQHVESLNDVVGKITGIRVTERVPDHVIDRADEMVLVDLPPEELLQRLREGKVYMPRQAERAMEHFFRKGNLLALRELALRRTADRVDGDMRAWRREKSVTTVWPTRESVLVCVGPGPDSESLVRRAARRANLTGAPWHAIVIETPSMQQLPDAARARIFGILKLAREMGAQTANLSGPNPVEIAIAYAREYNLGTLLVGRDRYRRLPWQHGFAEKVARLAPDLELLQVAIEKQERESPQRSPVPDKPAPKNGEWSPYLMAFLIVALVTVVSEPLHALLDLANIVMIFLLAVVFTAIRFGRAAAVLSSFLSVAAFDFFFVPPRFTFAVHDAQYLVTFTVMLIVALVVGQLTAGLRFQASEACKREQRMQALYEMSKDLSSALSVEQIIGICRRFIQRGFNASVAVFVPGTQENLEWAEGSAPSDAVDSGIAQWSFDHGENAGLGTTTLPSAHALYVPLKAPSRLCGVLALVPETATWELPPGQQQLLDTSASLIAIALERVHYVILSQESQVRMESERLRNSLLSAISHDLRTPLTVITGLTDAMCLATPPLSEPHLSLADAIRDEVSRTVTMVNNLLDMARMQMGHIVLKRSWQTLEEVIGLSMNHCASLLSRHGVRIAIPTDLPLLELDTGLMERVFNNLLENAAKHTPPGSVILISARHEEERVRISICDNGPGIPQGLEETLFDKFTRGKTESSVIGFGLGLAIVRAIIEAHGGSVWAHNGPDGGACFTFLLPVGNPPHIPEEP